jgi:small subunit ribosomal protein S20
MANHKSAEKRIRNSRAKYLRNKYQHKTARNFVRKLQATEAKKDAEVMLPKAYEMLDKLAKRNIIHKNKASNLKSQLSKHVAAL